MQWIGKDCGGQSQVCWPFSVSIQTTKKSAIIACFK